MADMEFNYTHSPFEKFLQLHTLLSHKWIADLIRYCIRYEAAKLCSSASFKWKIGVRGRDEYIVCFNEVAASKTRLTSGRLSQ